MCIGIHTHVCIPFTQGRSRTEDIPEGGPQQTQSPHSRKLFQRGSIYSNSTSICAPTTASSYSTTDILTGSRSSRSSSNRVKQLRPRNSDPRWSSSPRLPTFEMIQLYFDLKGRDELGRVLWRFLIQNNIPTHNLMAGSFNVNHLSALQGSGVRLGLITCGKHTITQYYDLLCDLFFMSIDKSILDEDDCRGVPGTREKVIRFYMYRHARRDVYSLVRRGRNRFRYTTYHMIGLE